MNLDEGIQSELEEVVSLCMQSFGREFSEGSCEEESVDLQSETELM
jgi:hypothetical protein